MVVNPFHVAAIFEVGLNKSRIELLSGKGVSVNTAYARVHELIEEALNAEKA